jgi:HAD superfamily hydrolase (TIGR01509 family)
MREARFRPAAVLLDMDGTLVDTEPIWFDATRSALEGLGHTLPEGAASDLLGLDTEAVIELMSVEYGIPITREALGVAVARELGPALRHAPARAGAAELVGALHARDVPRAIVSNSSHVVIAATLAAHEWAPWLERRYSVEDVGVGKPAPDVYLHAARSLGVEPSACVAVEDSVTGATAAVRAGMVCLAVAFDGVDPEALRRVTPNVLDSLGEVLAVLGLEEGVLSPDG